MRKYALGALAIAVVVAAFVYIGIGFHHFSEDWDKYGGVSIVDNRDEVLYRLGFPPSVLDDSQKNVKYAGRRSYATNRKEAGVDPDKVMPEGKTVADYYEWAYPVKGLNNASADTFIDFDRATKAIQVIDCVDFSEGQHACAPLAGVQIGDTEERVKDNLGLPDNIELDGVTKTMFYDQIGVEFMLTKGSVYYLRRVKTDKLSQVHLLSLYLKRLFS